MKKYVPFAGRGYKAVLMMLMVFLLGRESYAQDLCSAATPITSSSICAGTAGTLVGATYTAIASACGTANRNDVWFSFTAQTVNPTVAITTAVANVQFQIYTAASCGGAVTSVQCVAATTGTLTGLTVGSGYLIRVYSNTNATGIFTICVTDPAPVNDLCTSAATLTSGVACTNTAGSVEGATYTSASGATACSGTDVYDVWYKFTAQTPNPTITISSAGSGFISPQVQLLSGTCGSFTSVGCGANSYTASGLTIGTVYYVRVYSTSLPAATSNGTFNICITDPAPANDLCSSPVSISSAATCVTTSGYLSNSTTYTAIASVCGANNDVWYSFTAQTVNPTIKITTAIANPRFQVYTAASCGGTPVSMFCSGSGTGTATGLTVGAVYLVRVYTTGNATGVFTICITDPAPGNDLCSAPVTLVSGPTCTNTAGTVISATYSGGTTACSGTDVYDVWYKFVAQTTNPTVTISSAGAGFISPQVQLLSGTCAAFTSIGCGANSYTASGLSIGTTYYVRVYSTTAPAATANGTFNICITDPAPVNDVCTGAITLTSGGGCGSTIYTLMGATASALAGCGNAASADVWFAYTATSHYPSIVLSGLNATYTAAVPYIELYDAPSCTAGVFSGTSIACGSGTTLQVDTTVAGAGLTIGNTYYIRIYSGSAGPFTATGTAWQFKLCITDNTVATSAAKYGKSYVNITKGVNGGTIEPGDTLEMRATFYLNSGSIYNMTATGNIPANTTYVTNSMRILTNEGQLYKQWTDAADGDPGTVSGSTVTINLGKGATGTKGGTLKNSYKPTVFGSACLIVVAYRVVVNAVSYGTTINIGGGSINYTNNAITPVATAINFPAVTAMVYKNTGICANTVGSNGVLSEFGGTFGSGNTKNRFASTKVPPNYIDTVLTTGTPQDNYYGIANNTSSGGANYSINPADPVLAHHIFNVWDIIGDHTGAASATAGNPPTDTTGGNTGGYMLVVNAAFGTDTAFLDTVKNLCPNTYYEYSTWFRNLCRNCSGDSLGHGPTAGGYVPTGPGDSSGVHPNLTFNINGYDYYTTGDILYTGQWIKKGFTYLTGPGQTQMIISIRNNAPGGGGNDWVLDDIGVATCTPNLVLNPATPTVNVCYGDGTSISADVKSFFNNYTEYIWEKSTDNGATYTSTGFSGSSTPVFNGTEYVYTAVGPSFIGDSTTNNNIFRLRVASSSANLTDTNCSFSGTRTVQVYVHNCLWLLKTDLINERGNLQNNIASIQWQTVNESDQTNFEIEKSTDGIHFTMIAAIKGSAQNGNGTYVYNDPAALNGPAYYRIKMTDKTSFKYSKLILLSPNKISFTVKNLVNPFSNTISCNVIVPGDGDIKATIFDLYGRVIKTYKQPAEKGVNPLQIQDITTLSGGTYFLKIEWQNESIIQKIIRSN